MKPLLLLDVDGPLNPYRASNKQLKYSDWRKARLASGWAQCRVRLNRNHGPMLMTFAEQHAVELAWCTMWGVWAANAFIGRELGLPELDGVPLDSLDVDYVQAHGQAWKFGYVEQWAGARPLAWFDDEFQIEHVFRDAFLQHRDAAGLSTLLIDVAPSEGLSEDHLKTVSAWLTGGNAKVWEWAHVAGPKVMNRL